MPKPSQKVEFNTFIQGLITEASPLNFPPNASSDEENFELDRDGSRQRRRGFSFESGYGMIPAVGLSLDSFTTALPVTYKWTEVSGNPNLNFVVVQAHNHLYFFDMAQDVLSADGYLGSIEITNFPGSTRYSITSVEGFLIAAAGVDTVAVVTYDNPGFSVTYERLTTRDVWGVEV
jgi:hypothetical protein